MAEFRHFDISGLARFIGGIVRDIDLPTMVTLFIPGVQESDALLRGY